MIGRFQSGTQGGKCDQKLGGLAHAGRGISNAHIDLYAP